MTVRLNCRFDRLILPGMLSDSVLAGTSLSSENAQKCKGANQYPCEVCDNQMWEIG